MSGAWLTSTRAQSDAHPSNQAAVQNLSCADCSVSAQVVNFGAAVAELEDRKSVVNGRREDAGRARSIQKISRHKEKTSTALRQSPSAMSDRNHGRTSS